MSKKNYVTAAVMIGGKSVVTAKKQARNAALKAAVAMVVPLHRYLVGTYGADSPILEEFGYPVTTPKQPTTQVKAEAVTKRRNTRAAKKPQATPPATPATPAKS